MTSTDNSYFCSCYYGLAVHRVINHAVGSVLPNGLQRGILDGIFILGRAQLSDFILNEKNPLGIQCLLSSSGII